MWVTTTFSFEGYRIREYKGGGGHQNVEGEPQLRGRPTAMQERMKHGSWPLSSHARVLRSRGGGMPVP